MEHNFKKVDYSFDSEGSEDCCKLWCDGAYVASIGYGPCSFDEIIASKQTEANARRIAACINYCEGIDTEFLEASAKMPKSLLID